MALPPGFKQIDGSMLGGRVNKPRTTINSSNINTSRDGIKIQSITPNNSKNPNLKLTPKVMNRAQGRKTRYSKSKKDPISTEDKIQELTTDTKADVFGIPLAYAETGDDYSSWVESGGVHGRTGTGGMQFDDASGGGWGNEKGLPGYTDPITTNTNMDEKPIGSVDVGLKPDQLPPKEDGQTGFGVIYPWKEDQIEFEKQQAAQTAWYEKNKEHITISPDGNEAYKIKLDRPVYDTQTGGTTTYGGILDAMEKQKAAEKKAGYNSFTGEWSIDHTPDRERIDPKTGKTITIKGHISRSPPAFGFTVKQPKIEDGWHKTLSSKGKDMWFRGQNMSDIKIQKTKEKLKQQRADKKYHNALRSLGSVKNDPTLFAEISKENSINAYNNLFDSFGTGSFDFKSDFKKRVNNMDKVLKERKRINDMDKLLNPDNSF